jgi:hypothetical protein
MMARQLISLRALKAFTFDENVNYYFLNEALKQKPNGMIESLTDPEEPS